MCAAFHSAAVAASCSLCLWSIEESERQFQLVSPGLVSCGAHGTGPSAQPATSSSYPHTATLSSPVWMNAGLGASSDRVLQCTASSCGLSGLRPSRLSVSELRDRELCLKEDGEQNQYLPNAHRRNVKQDSCKVYRRRYAHATQAFCLDNSEPFFCSF